MPQSLSKVIVHIVFSTKDRQPWLDKPVRQRVHAYLATVCRDMGAEFVRAGGVSDHVHILTTLPRTVSQAELVEQVKTTSSKWIKNIDQLYAGFRWQRGYGVFSVNPGEIDGAAEYIDSQTNHHRIRSFQEEYRELLHRHGIQFDEKYLWD